MFLKMAHDNEHNFTFEYKTAFLTQCKQLQIQCSKKQHYILYNRYVPIEILNRYLSQFWVLIEKWRVGITSGQIEDPINQSRVFEATLWQLMPHLAYDYMSCKASLLTKWDSWTDAASYILSTILVALVLMTRLSEPNALFAMDFFSSLLHWLGLIQPFLAMDFQESSREFCICH